MHPWIQPGRAGFRARAHGVSAFPQGPLTCLHLDGCISSRLKEQGQQEGPGCHSDRPARDRASAKEGDEMKLNPSWQKGGERYCLL
jgi:hypothetical protein